MSAGNDFAAGASLFNSVWDRAEAAKEAKRKAEWENYVRGRERDYNQRFDQAYADVGRQLDQAAATTDFDASQYLGMQGPTPEERMKLGYAQYGASQSPTYDNATDGAQFQPQAKPTRLSMGQGFAEQMQMLKSQLGLAKTGAEINTVMSSMRDLKRSAERSSLESQILGMDPASLDAIVKQISDDPRQNYKAEKQKDGTYLIGVDGSSPVKMSKAQIAKWIGASHALKNGDRTALDDIAKIDENLAAQVATQFSRAKDMATVGNQAFTAADNAAYHRGSLGLQREQARNAKMGAPITAYDKDNNPIIMVPTMANGKMTFERVTLPEGARLPKQPQTLSDQEKIAYENWIKTEAPQLAGKPPAEVAMSMRRYGLDPLKLGVSDPTAEIAEAIRRKQSGGTQQQTPPPTGVVPEQQMPTTSAEAYARWRELSPSVFSLPRFGDNYRGKQADAEQAAQAEQMLRLFHQLQAQGK